ncbi:hypothetical protein AYL99_03296 [Fonsecaea erecta]|uniref:CCD97-like C-terminal domain-containing protein n=1 Tax=Fonsecaea erecta TaxID=1367422 RepID=A0A178ZQ08_9EURO|nr:hypothetical protein AYL99_03296 [Fonsecaea erecta]OAP61095.1 hypothetical protein AYL99_03296 [Fonsecaea erecta]
MSQPREDCRTLTGEHPTTTHLLKTIPYTHSRIVEVFSSLYMSDPPERPAWSDVTARLRNLRNLLSSERHLGIEHEIAFEEFEREMEDQMATFQASDERSDQPVSSESANSRERRRREFTTRFRDQDTAESRTQSSVLTALLRSRRRAFRPSERLQRYQRERLGQSGRAAALEASVPPLSQSPASPTQSVGDRADRPRSKRRKLTDGTYQDDPETFSYGHNGQVVPGQLRLEIVSCDGGEYSDPHIPIYSYPQNVLLDDTSVYCTKSNKCNLLLKHVGGMPFTLTDIVVKAPRAGYDAPIQNGLIFVAMEDDNLLDRTSQYDVRWPPKIYRHQRHRRDGYRPSQEYMNSTRSPLRSIERPRHLNNPTAPEEGSHLEIPLVPGFHVTVVDPSDGEEGGEEPPSPRPWQDVEDSLRSYVDRYRPVYGGNERNDPWSNTSDSEGYEPDIPPEAGEAGETARLQRQQIDLEDILAHRNRMLDLMRAQQIRESDEFFGSRNRESELDEDRSHSRRPTSSRNGTQAFAPTTGMTDPAYLSQERSEASSSKATLNGVAAGSSARVGVVPHALFFINPNKSSTEIKFDPPVSGRYILVKLWAQCAHANIDIQAILAHGYVNPLQLLGAIPWVLYFKYRQRVKHFGMPRFVEGTGIPLRENVSLQSKPASSTEPPTPDRIRIKNRRKRYLDTHPEYFGPQLELADPLLYDRLIRRFQTPAEREAEGRQKGYSGILEADLYRSEAKLEALRHPDPHALFTYRRGPNGEILAEDRDEVPANKEEGLARWKWEMQVRFLRGGDDDFDYDAVDNNPEYDDRILEERDAEDRYFDEQEPEFVKGEEGLPRSQSHEELEGETGIQDF